MIAFVLLLAGLAFGCLVVAFAVALRRTSPSPSTKAWWRSKTLWINVATIVGAGVAIVEVATGELRKTLPEWAYFALLAVLAMLNAGLRLVTTKGLSNNPHDQ